MVNPIEREIAVYDLEKTRYFKMYKECAPKERCFKYRFVGSRIFKLSGIYAGNIRC